MSVSLTKAAAAHIRKCLEGMPQAIGFQIGLTKKGCSGLSYQYDYVQEPLSDAVCFQSEGISVWVRQEHLYALEGMRLDCVRQGLNTILVPENPDSQNACGCGESFNVG